jgi:eukaryotic-like serine/threonine-protein kinase
MPSSPVDRNLIFGILALQMDFIHRDPLIAAMNAWVLNKQSPLGQILVDHGALGVDAKAVLDALVDKHLELHQNDPQQSLAAIHVPRVLHQDLERLADPDVHATLAGLGTVPEKSLSGQTTLPPASAHTGPGERFEILRPHAWGGLGEVFVAQDRELNREVALKKMHERHAGNADSRMRFLLEAEITGGLEHPGIVPVYGLGMAQDGRPYYAMRFIRGQTLKEAIEQFHSAGPRSETERRIELRRLLNRFQAVCNAIEYAHNCGVIHRDLKPSNIMLGKYGETLVVDWGLAKAMGRRDHPTTDESTLVPSSGTGSSETLPGSAIGTPAFMSPEQANGQIAQIGPASDVYSLGATLYALLTRKEPFESSVIGVILGKVQSGDFPPPIVRNPLVPPPLNAICLKAMSLAPEDRYPSCAALASDIEHWLADEPVTALRDAWSTRAVRWVRRNRVIAARVAGLTAGLLIGLVVAIILLSRANTRVAAQRQMADEQRAEATRQRDEATLQRTVALRERAESNRQRAVAERERADATRQLYVSQMNLAERAWEDLNVGRTRELLDSQMPEHTGGVDLRGWEWHHLWRLTHSELRKLSDWALCLAFSPDGKFLAWADESGTLKFWDAGASREIRSIQAHDRRIDRLIFSRDGSKAATASLDGTAKLWDTANGRLMRTFPAIRSVRYGLALSPDGSQLAVGAVGIAVWSTPDGKRLRTLEGQTGFVAALAFSPNGKSLASGSGDGTVRLWDLASGKELRRYAGTLGSVVSLTVSPDGRLLAAGTGGGAVKVWELESGRETMSVQAHSRTVFALAFSPDGQRIASGSDDTSVKISDVATGRELQSLRSHASGITAVTFSPTGDVLATGGWDQAIRLWDAASRQEPWSLPLPSGVSSVAFSPDNRWLAAGDGNVIGVWDASNGLPVWTESEPLTSVIIDTANTLRFDPESRVLASALADGTIHIRDAKDGRLLRTLSRRSRESDPLKNLLSALTAPVPSVMSLGFSPDGRLLAAGSADGTLALWNPHEARMLAALKGHLNRVTNVVFSPNGKFLASAGEETRNGVKGGDDHRVRLWDVASGREVRQFVHETVFSGEGRHDFTGVFCIVFSRDGRQIFTGSRDDMIRVWDVETGRLIRIQKGHAGDVLSLSLSPDGARLASCGHDGTLRIWDTALGQDVQTLKPHAGRLMSVAFSPDGSRLAAGADHNQVVVWDARPLTADLRNEMVVVDFLARAAFEVMDEEGLLKRVREHPWSDGAVRKRALEMAGPFWQSQKKSLAARHALEDNDEAWRLATNVDAKLRNPVRALELAKKAVELAPAQAIFWNTLGVAEYRAGGWQPAIEAFHKSMQLRGGGDAFDWFFLSMAHWRQGAKDEAHRWYGRAVAWSEKNGRGNDELRRFREEADELLRSADPSASTVKPQNRESKAPPQAKKNSS